MGHAKRPFYRIVVMDSAAPRDGASLGQVGTYDPLQARVEIDEPAALKWLSRGARLTDTVRSLLDHQGILARWKGREGKVVEGALSRVKPVRRRKLGQAAATAPAADDAATAAVAEEPSAPA
jgi:small subunit ribosomal protein S16